MKQRLLSYCLLACLSILLACFSACSRKDEPAPTPSSVAASPATIAKAQAWFKQQAPTSFASAGKAGTAAREGDEQPAISWTQAILLDEHLIAPFADSTHTFNSSGKYGYRFLVVRLDEDSTYTGRIVELITPEQPASSEAAAAVALAGAEPLLDGQQPGPIADFTGTLLAYSPGYDYETGLAYQDGVVQPLQMRLYEVPPPGMCYEYYLVGYNNVGVMVVHELQFSVCTPLAPGNGGWGGNSGGGTGAPSGTQQTTSIDPSQLVPCQAAVLARLQALNGTAALDIITLFSGPGPNYNWVVKDGRLGAGLYGNTTGPYDRATHTVTTEFDSQKWGDATDLSIARTMLHESVHAFLLAYFANNPRLVNATYPRLVAAWNAESLAGGTADLNIIHHAEMGQSWVGDIAWSLKQYGISQNYNLPDQFYQDMAWGGLETTREFLALPLADRQRIHDIIIRELTGKNAQGNTVPQSGQKSGC